MFKKVLIIGLAAGLVLGAMGASAEAKKKKRKPPAPKKVERVVDFAYQCPCAGLFQLGAATGGDPNLGGGVFSVGDESFLTAVATDATGQKIPVTIEQDTDGDGFNNLVGTFCGETTEPMPINPGLEIRVFIGDPQVCPGPAAMGSIKFTLSNLP